MAGLIAIAHLLRSSAGMPVQAGEGTAAAQTGLTKTDQGKNLGAGLAALSAVRTGTAARADTG